MSVIRRGAFMRADFYRVFHVVWLPILSGLTGCFNSGCLYRDDEVFEGSGGLEL